MVLHLPNRKRQRRDCGVSLLAPLAQEAKEAKARQDKSLKVIHARLDARHVQDMGPILALRAQTSAALLNQSEEGPEDERKKKTSVPR